MAGRAPVEVRLHRIRLPLVRPHRAAHGTEAVREVVLVEAVGADGAVGWGECSALAAPTYTAEHLDGAWLVLRDHLVPAALAGRDHAVVGNPMAVAALDGALADLALCRGGRSLRDSVAARLGRPRPALARTAVVGLGAAAEVLDAVAAAVGGGAAAVKLKVTPRPEALDVVSTVRAEHPDLPLAADANGSLDQRSVSILDDLGLLYLEQPAPADDLVASARWAQRCRTPIALDESVGSVGDLEAAAALGAGAILNVKPARLGGIGPAVEVVQRAGDLGLDVFVGGMLESGVGRATALALAASARCTLPTDLGPSAAYTPHDVTSPPIGLDGDGRVVPPTGPGIGVVVDRDRLAEVGVDRLVLR